MKDAVATMGTILPEDAGGRDAVHVAVFSASSNIKLFPGQGVSIVGRGELDTVVAPLGETIGIVDPFLGHSVEPGNRFWVYLFPRTITALSHRWNHPAFEETGSSYAPPAAKIASEEWLREFVRRSDVPSYESVMGLAAARADQTDVYDDGYDADYLIFHGQDAHGEIPDKFWKHVEIVLGRPIRGSRAKYFSCSC